MKSGYGLRSNLDHSNVPVNVELWNTEYSALGQDHVADIASEIGKRNGASLNLRFEAN